MYTFTFTTREEYLQQKKEWFAEYKAAIQQIRKAKHDYKDYQRGKITWSQRTLFGKAYHELNQLLEARSASRIEAQRQWCASHQTA